MLYVFLDVSKLLFNYGSFYRPDVAFFSPTQLYIYYHGTMIWTIIIRTIIVPWYYKTRYFFQFISRHSFVKAAIYNQDLKLY